MFQEIDLKDLRGERKIERLKIKPDPNRPPQKKPAWIRIKTADGEKVGRLKNILRAHNLFSVCEEARCPNLNECFAGGTATFMIMGQICTRRCPFCDVAHGKPKPLNGNEPENLAHAIGRMGLDYAVITSVDRDDLKDGGAAHFARCIRAIRKKAPKTAVEILTPDFRGRAEKALAILQNEAPDVFNHNLETVPRLYPKVRPGADYAHSLRLLQNIKTARPAVITKSGLMLGLGERKAEVVQVMKDLRAHFVDMLTLGQYLRPSRYHLAVERYLEPVEFEDYAKIAEGLGFSQVASAPLVRSSYRAKLNMQKAKNV